MSKETKRKERGAYSTPYIIASLMLFFVKPQIGQTIYDPACGTGELLIDAFEYLNKDISGIAVDILRNETLYGREIVHSVYEQAVENFNQHK